MKTFYIEQEEKGEPCIRAVHAMNRQSPQSFVQAEHNGSANYFQFEDDIHFEPEMVCDIPFYC